MLTSTAINTQPDALKTKNTFQNKNQSSVVSGLVKIKIQRLNFRSLLVKI